MAVCRAAAVLLRRGQNDVEERTASNASPPPAGLVKRPEAPRDLLAYLLSDKPLRL